MAEIHVGTRVYHRTHLGTGTVTEPNERTFWYNVPVQWDEDYHWLLGGNNVLGVHPVRVKSIPPSGVPQTTDWWTDAECRVWDNWKKGDPLPWRCST